MVIPGSFLHVGVRDAFAAVAALVAATVIAACASDADPRSAGTRVAPQTGKVVVLGEAPHDPTAYTEGLVLDGGVLYESTGILGRSQLRALDPGTGQVQQSVALGPELFGEGLAAVGDKLWQLTFRNEVAIQWDRVAGLVETKRVAFTGEGWGLCYDGTRLIRSDGTDRLHFHDPNTFAELGTVSVTIDGQPQRRLNELECDEGRVWANVYPSNQIVRIDPTSGQVTATVDAGGLLDDSARRGGAEVLNGIAATGAGEYLLTGKYWPAMFRVRFDLQ